VKKRLLFSLGVFAIFFGGVVFFLYFNKQADDQDCSQAQDNGAGVLGFNHNNVNLVGLDENIAAVWYKVSMPANLTLKSNLESKETAGNIFSSRNCKFLVSSGFYDTNDTHIGLFQYKGEVISPLQSNKLLNGVLSINSFNTPRISEEPPKDDLLLGLQSGPLLYSNGQELALDLRSDKPSRRIVAAITGYNELIFIALYSNEQVFLGPLLSEVPGYLTTFIDKSGIQIADAINLDGGKASAFILENFKLTELSVIGGYFCYID